MRVVRWFVAALAWVLAVALVAGVAWFAIDSAGREVGAAAPVILVPAGNVSPAPTDEPGRPVPASATPSATAATTALEVPQSPSGSPPVSPSVSSASPAAPAASGSSAPPVAPSRPGRPSTSPTPPAPRPPPGPANGRNGTYSSVAGDLTVRCAGSSVEGWGVRPADGWRVDAAPGPRGALVVVFTADGRVVEVEATCRDGVAVFRPTPPG